MIKAKFAFYWDFSKVRGACYVITESHLSNYRPGMAVSEEQLRALGAEIPPTPDREEWEAKGKPLAWSQ